MKIDDLDGPEVIKLKEILNRCCQKLSEIRTGTDLECECWDLAEEGYKCLKKYDQ